MSNEEKKNTLSANLSAALNPAKIENPANIDPVTRQEIQKKSLSELKVEIHFHLGQMAGHAVEIGKLLIEAKEQVGHGEFGKWIEENFNLKWRMAQNFMAIAERFGNTHLNAYLNQSQMIQMLALPAGEEENFIAEKAAEGTPVEDMTVKNLKAEIADYKKRLAQAEEDAIGYKRASEMADEQLENLDEENQNLKRVRDEEGKRLGALLQENLDLKADKEDLQEKVDDLENKLFQAEPETVEVAPADYEPTKKKLAEIEAENEKLQTELKNLQDRPIEVATEYPADYESVKVELAELKEKQKNFQADYSVAKKISEIFSIAPALLNTVELSRIVADMADNDINFGAKLFKAVHAIGEIESYYKMWKEKKAE